MSRIFLRFRRIFSRFSEKTRASEESDHAFACFKGLRVYFCRFFVSYSQGRAVFPPRAKKMCRPGWGRIRRTGRAGLRAGRQPNRAEAKSLSPAPPESPLRPGTRRPERRRKNRERGTSTAVKRKKRGCGARGERGADGGGQNSRTRNRCSPPPPEPPLQTGTRRNGDREGKPGARGQHR